VKFHILKKAVRWSAVWLGAILLVVALMFALPGLWLTEWAKRWELYR